MFNEAQESNIILQGVLLTGIKDIKFDSSVNESSTKLLSNQGIRRKIYGPQKTTCSFSKPYNGKDFIQSLTGVADLSGQFIYKNNALDFSQAAISSYSLNLDEEGFGEIKVTMQIFGDVKPTTNLQLSTASEDFPILDQTPTMTHFDLDGKNSAIKSLNYEASLNPKSSNNIGSVIASNVDFTSPTVHKISADIEMLEQEVEDATGFSENDKLTKNINIIFAPEVNKPTIDEILTIQTQVSLIKGSGFKTDDFDFSLGSCAYNAFRFDKSSISNQNLNAKAGEVVQLNNQYNAYTNIKKITGSIPVPAENLSCEQHFQEIQNNFALLKNRINESFFSAEIDFEKEQIGQTGLINFNFFTDLFDFENEQIGEFNLIKLVRGSEDFELETVGAITDKIIHFNSFLSLEDFESKLIGDTQTDLYQLPAFNEDSFETSQIGLTGLINFVINDFENEVDFEAISPQATGLDFPVAPPFDREVDFEGDAIGAVTFDKLTIDNFENKVDFELETVGEITDLNEFIINDFENKVDFELETVGAITLFNFADAGNEIDFEPNVVGPVTLGKFVINDFENETNFEDDTVGTVALANIIFDDFENETDFELETLGSTLLDFSVAPPFDREVDFEGENLGTVGLDNFIIDDFENKVDFEGDTAGVVTLEDLTIDNFENQVDFEGETPGTFAITNMILNDFKNETNFEGETVGTTNTNLYSL
tara:strand:- start:3581 stop:5707 length:2127 start_codon:yes stop_codon:yes gene_type:complete